MCGGGYDTQLIVAVNTVNTVSAAVHKYLSALFFHKTLPIVTSVFVNFPNVCYWIKSPAASNLPGSSISAVSHPLLALTACEMPSSSSLSCPGLTESPAKDMSLMLFWMAQTRIAPNASI